jgi:hypothetical protein
MTERPKFLDFFCGIRGLSLGLERAGLSPIAASIAGRMQPELLSITVLRKSACWETFQSCSLVTSSTISASSRKTSI